MTRLAADKKKIFLALAGAGVLLLAWLTGTSLAAALFLLILAFYLKYRRNDFQKFSLLNFSFLYVLIFVTSYLMVKHGIPVYYIPFAIGPMLAMLLFNSLELSLLLNLACGVTVSAFSPDPFTVLLLFLIGGSLASILVRGARRRTTIIASGLVIGCAQVVTLIFIDRFWLGVPSRYTALFLNGLASGAIVLAILPAFEYLFGTVTNISLLELADFNHPLLQRMIQEAPGTYHHSLVVGNLSESACRAIGCNALLARVGAYYHDIGKLHKPEYFSENQDISASKHEKLSPTMSKLIIMNHVKEGAELAAKYRLSPALADFILQHHGNSLVYYFYRRALEELEDDHEVKEEGFRYPGPKPNTKETAIVLLADSAEAATRALKDSAPAKIEEIVHKVINNKFIDGQLDECDLTLKDLEKISAVFIRILGGIYHARVGYPEGPISENNHKKPAKENSHLSDKDKKSNS
ncbi:MAG: HDIG domain-containing protein [Candidatus Omnitrophica bacterium]|nr:HDIG domain-containing protein [Candidatus Omnitrophota bacterium]